MKATKESWINYPISTKYRKIGVNIIFSKKEFENISTGYVPIEYGDRWFVYFEDRELIFCQINGQQIFRLEIIKINSEKYKALSLIIVQDTKVKPIKSIQTEIETLNSILQYLKIRKN